MGATARARSPLDLNTIVWRVSASLPLLAHTELDRGLRMMLLCHLIRQCYADGTPLPVIQGSYA